MNSIVMYLVFSLLCLSPGSVVMASSQRQMINIKVLERDEYGQCSLVEEIERVRNEVHQIFAPVSGCNGPGWRRVAFINMTDTSYNCPAGLNLTSYSKRTCGRSHTAMFECSSTTFSIGGLPYSRVCGRIRAYQFRITAAFWQFTQGIDYSYVDGVSLTHGGAGGHQHIWTFAAGATEVKNNNRLAHKCACDISRNYDRVPAFVGNDYFCESGLHSRFEWPGSLQFHPNDILWDGQNCTSTSTCCQFNNPPWFTKNLTNTTTDDIELRLCTSDAPELDDVPIELIELYVQ